MSRLVYRPQSSSASRFTAGASEFFILIQSRTPARLHLPPHPEMSCANAPIDIDACKTGNASCAA